MHLEYLRNSFDNSNYLIMSNKYIIFDESTLASTGANINNSVQSTIMKNFIEWAIKHGLLNDMERCNDKLTLTLCCDPSTEIIYRKSMEL
ncbi:hypothetical protein QLL95_gp1277 [Cotonvirus japonicus]|uniref:Uncharacterized protein n=1 Tax=Cotonvirus japonicus TaxID=2811091 RepID=A0ABM7NRW9_9VIRU|nr:hypothetical protein QLL95_gp1277 [Cotonvirus japonicus]BCS82846.1 hypothetical protein [Cotonvirus japonicus]